MKGGLPFILMESTPSQTNWFHTPQLKRPGQHRQEMLHAIGHGADSAMYFQWRKGQGGFEKFHGAVVDHEGGSGSRVFRDVASLGAELQRLDAVVGTTVRPEVALVHDWEIRWALSRAQGPRQGAGDWFSRFDKEYLTTSVDHYRPVLEAGRAGGRHREQGRPRPLPAGDRADAVPAAAGRGRSAARIRHRRAARSCSRTSRASRTRPGSSSAEAGRAGDCASSRASGSEEIDSLYPNPSQRIVMKAGNPLGFAGEHAVREYCELVHAEKATVLATYANDFYAGGRA